MTLPKYITNHKNTRRTILWTALYAELFITIYQPFNSRRWIAGVDELRYFLVATLAVLVAMLVITISRVSMCYFTKKHDLSLVDYISWVVVEIVGMSLVYAMAPVLVLHVEDRFLSLWGQAIVYTTFILCVPYAIVMLSLLQQQYRRQLEAAGLREKRQGEADEAAEGMFNFRDEKGELKLSIRPDALYYIEAADNYVQIHYMTQGQMRQFMLRGTLRRIESAFPGRDLVRCHRSFIVYFPKVRVLKRTDDGLVMDFDIPSLPNIPVSKTYADKVMTRFQQDSAIS